MQQQTGGSHTLRVVDLGRLAGHADTRGLVEDEPEG